MPVRAPGHGHSSHRACARPVSSPSVAEVDASARQPIRMHPVPCRARCGECVALRRRQRDAILARNHGDDNDQTGEVAGRGDRGGAGERARRARVGLAARTPAGALAHVRPARDDGAGNRRCRLGKLRRRRTARVRRGAGGGDGQARPGSPTRRQPLPCGKPDLSGPLCRRLEPLVHHGARWRACRRGGAPAWPDGYAVQRAPHRAALSGRRLRRGRDPAARAWHGAERPDGCPLGPMERSDAACRPRSAPARRTGGAVARDRVFQRRRAGDEVRARRDRRQGASAARSHRADLADDRGHEHGAFRRDRRVAGGVPVVREGRMAGHRAGVQSLQVQLVPGERRAPIVARGPHAAGANRAARAATAGSRSWRRY